MDIRGTGFCGLQIFDKKSASHGSVANNEIKQNLQLAGELHKPISKNFKKRI